MSAEIKPCPFCGCEDISISHTTICGNGIARAVDGVCIKCRNCGAMIADDESGIPARVRWNKRRAPSHSTYVYLTDDPEEIEKASQSLIFCEECGNGIKQDELAFSLTGDWRKIICSDCLESNHMIRISTSDGKEMDFKCNVNRLIIKKIEKDGMKMEYIPGYDAWKTRTPPEPEPSAYCSYCGAELYGGDRVLQIEGFWICDDCIDSHKEEVPWKGEE